MKIKKIFGTWLAFIATMALCATVCFQVYAYLQTPKPPITKTVEITMNVRPAPDFTLTHNISTGHIDTFINRTLGIAVTVESVNEFAGVVEFAVSGIPDDWTVNYFPADHLTLGPDSPKGISIEIIIPDDAALVGNYTIAITATSTNYN